MKILVCGGRDYKDYEKVCNILDQYSPSLIIEGGARGVDTFARLWAENNDIPVKTENANWKRYGRSAGPIRNKFMLEKHDPDLVITFPGGSGTNNMIKQAKASGIKVIEIHNDMLDRWENHKYK